jgi:polyphosphate kinase
VRIEDAALCTQLVRILDIYLADNQQARELLPDGSYQRLVAPSPEEARSALDDLLAAASGQGQEANQEEQAGLPFRPRSKDG